MGCFRTETFEFPVPVLSGQYSVTPWSWEFTLATAWVLNLRWKCASFEICFIKQNENRVAILDKSENKFHCSQWDCWVLRLSSCYIVKKASSDSKLFLKKQMFPIYHSSWILALPCSSDLTVFIPQILIIISSFLESSHQIFWSRGYVEGGLLKFMLQYQNRPWCPPTSDFTGDTWLLFPGRKHAGRVQFSNCSPRTTVGQISGLALVKSSTIFGTWSSNSHRNGLAFHQGTPGLNMRNGLFFSL